MVAAMARRTARPIALLVALLLAGCGAKDPPGQPLFTMNERQIDATLRQLHRSEPDLTQRVLTLARRNLGQPYEIYLLGEAPFETIDPQPVYCLDRSDCVVFTEHTLAMALSEDFPTFLAMLQRIRYRDGRIGVVTRNHYTEADWNRANAWLLTEVTEQVGGERTRRYPLRVDRAKFLRERYALEVDAPVETIEEPFIAHGDIPAVKRRLRAGDVVNFVRGREGSFWVGHVGIISVADGDDVRIIHSAGPAVREQSIDEFLEPPERPVGGGFKFQRLTADPWGALRAIDGPDAPRVIVPAGSPITFDAYVRSLGFAR